MITCGAMFCLAAVNVESLPCSSFFIGIMYMNIMNLRGRTVTLTKPSPYLGSHVTAIWNLYRPAINCKFYKLI